MSRVYIVEPQGNIVSGESRLVVAGNQAEAIRLVTKNVFACRPATTLEVARMISAGVKLEEAEPVVQENLTTENPDMGNPILKDASEAQNDIRT